jgi:hypothetical protein
MPIRHARRAFLPALVLLFAASIPASAQQFGWAGARSAAMGGAGVALADDATAVHFNPAGLALRPHADTIVAAGADATEVNDMVGAVDRLSKLDVDAVLADPEKLATAVRDLEILADPDTRLDGTIDGGIYLTQDAGGLSIVTRSWVGVDPDVDLVHIDPTDDPVTGFANNTTSARFVALRMDEIVLSYGMQVIPGMVMLGANARYIRGTTYDWTESVFALDGFDTWGGLRDALDENAERTNRVSSDIGILLTPIPSFRLGASVKYLNAPKFDLKAGGHVKLDRQIRIGFAFTPTEWDILAIAGDVDLAGSTKTLSDADVRHAGIGAELTLGTVVLRGGARTDLDADDRRIVPTFGIGVGSKRVKLDLAGAFRGDRDAEVQVSLHWSM